MRPLNGPISQPPLEAWFGLADVVRQLRRAREIADDERGLPPPRPRAGHGRAPFPGASAAAAAPTLEAFLAGLRVARQEGGVRPTARPKASKPRYRTVPDPLEAVTADLKAWLDAEPGVTGREPLDRLQATDPETYPDAVIRTVQHRPKVWRRGRARALVLGPCAATEAGTAARSSGTSPMKQAQPAQEHS